MARFERLRYHVALDRDARAGAVSRSAASFRGPPIDDAPPPEFSSDVGAARFYLDKLLQQDERAPLRSLRAPERAERVPDLRHVSTQDLAATKTRLVRFQQQAREIPIFGGQMVVELDGRRRLVSASGVAADVGDLTRVESVGRREALASIEKLTDEQIDPEAIPPASLVYFDDRREEQDNRAWHLAWFFRDIRAVPPTIKLEESSAQPHGLRGRSLRSSHRRMNYFVDAHDAAVLRYFSATPTIMVPTWCDGVDEDGVYQQFYGLFNGGAFEMRDPLRHVVTYDLGYQDLVLSRALPGSPVSNPSAAWAATAQAAVSAHVNAKRVSDFYKVPLQRDGIDDQGMDLISIVNCRYVDPQHPPEPYPEWVNAEWYDKRMWYGQVTTPAGTAVSLSRELDIIGHELTHGVIETSCDLCYQDESGALNESYADIFGIIIRNWYEAPDKGDVGTWNWTIGDGFGTGGGPLRDLGNPSRCGQPDHCSAYVHTNNDSGGVHSNSGIPNKAAYNVLTATDAEGTRVFTVDDAAILLYLAMVRLTNNASFIEAADSIVDATATLYAGSAVVRDAKVAAVKRAYAAVGIVAT